MLLRRSSFFRPKPVPKLFAIAPLHLVHVKKRVDTVLMVSRVFTKAFEEWTARNARQINDVATMDVGHRPEVNTSKIGELNSLFFY